MKHSIILGLLLLIPVSATQADSRLGRLFFTPDQRASLDQARQHNKTLDAANESAPDNITLNGVIKRSDGHHVVWINNRAFSDNSAVDRVTVSREKGSGRYIVQLPYSDKHVQLKVGQSMDAASGKVDEAYRNKTVSNPDKPVDTSPAQGKSTATARNANKNDSDEPMQ